MYKPEIKHETLTKSEYDALKSKTAKEIYDAIGSGAVMNYVFDSKVSYL